MLGLGYGIDKAKYPRTSVDVVCASPAQYQSMMQRYEELFSVSTTTNYYHPNLYSISPSNTSLRKTLPFCRSDLILVIKLEMRKPPFKRNPYLREKFGLTVFSLKSRFYCTYLQSFCWLIWFWSKCNDNILVLILNCQKAYELLLYTNFFHITCLLNTFKVIDITKIKQQISNKTSQIWLKFKQHRLVVNFLGCL